MNVVYCVTADYIEKIKPSIRSLREHNKCNVYVVTETDEVDIEGAKAINVKDQQIFTKSNCINYSNQFTYIGLMKAAYADLLPVKKVIHLDADTIVCDSLKPMWDINLKGKWYAMVQEYNGKYRPFGDKYYNAGVMVLNLEQMRSDGIQQTMIEYLRTVQQPWCEQDAFDKFGIEQDKIVPLDVRYNENQFTGYTEDPAIVHYAGISDWWSNNGMYRAEYLHRFRSPIQI